MGDLEALEEIAGPDGEWRPRKRREWHGWQKQFGNRPTHCKRGHEFTPENTRIIDLGGSQGRQCRTCLRLWNLAAKEARK